MSKRKWKVCCCFLICLLIGTTAPAFAADSTTTLKASMKYGQTESREMLKSINSFRHSSSAWYWNSDNTTKTRYSNLSSLKYDYGLEAVAMQRAAEIAIGYSHTRPNGEICFTAYGDLMYNGCAENIAAGYSTADSVFKGWREDNESYYGQGHRRSMLSPDYTSIGIAHVYYNGTHYWVQEFGSTPSNYPETSAFDGRKIREIEVLKSSLGNCTLSSDKSSYSVAYDGARKISSVRTNYEIKDHWGSLTCPVIDDVSLSIEDPTIATLDGSLIRGLKPGKTNLVCKSGSTTKLIPITVSKRSVSTATVKLSKIKYKYTGRPHKPTVKSVTVKDKLLVKGIDYTVSYSNNTKAGTAKVIITGKGNYKGKYYKSFKIVK